MIGIDESDRQTSYPITLQYIAYHAIRVPSNIAVIDQGKAFSYETFYRDICKMIMALRAFKFETGQSVAVEFLPQHAKLASFYFHWVTILAIETYGVATMSYTEDESWCLGDIRESLDLTMSFSGNDVAHAHKLHVMDGKWIKFAMAQELEAAYTQASIGSDTSCRIIKSSGTTGKMKFMFRSFENQDFIYRNAQFRGGFTRQSRYFVTMGFNVSAIQAAATTCVRSGGSCVYDTRTNAADTLAKYAITHVSFLLHSLMQVLDSLPKDYVKPPNLRLLTIGSAVSETVRKRILNSLASHFSETYGANECSTVSTMNAEGIGVFLPGVDVEVVNEHDEAVVGERGWIRVRSQGCVRGYINNPKATQKMFKNGWFYPGDMAVIKGHRMVQILGRADDLLNIRGIKYAPQEIEENLLEALPIREVCVVATADHEDIHHAVVVIVPQSMDDHDDIKKKLPGLVPRFFGNTKLMFVRELPRTAVGKIQRKKVAEMVKSGSTV